MTGIPLYPKFSPLVYGLKQRNHSYSTQKMLCWWKKRERKFTHAPSQQTYQAHLDTLYHYYNDRDYHYIAFSYCKSASSYNSKNEKVASNQYHSVNWTLFENLKKLKLVQTLNILINYNYIRYYLLFWTFFETQFAFWHIIILSCSQWTT